MAPRPSTAFRGRRLSTCPLASVDPSHTSLQNSLSANVSANVPLSVLTYSNASYDLAYDARLVDIWAVGVVYYCLHFQELPWRAAQSTDKLYSAYANACIANPMPVPPKTKSATTHSIQSATAAAPPLPSTPTKEGAPAKEGSGSQHNQTFPPTVMNLSPRGCRPLLRRMLEPDPKKRAAIEEVIKHPWLESIEICHSQEHPKHVHGCAQAMAAQLGLGGSSSS